MGRVNLGVGGRLKYKNSKDRRSIVHTKQPLDVFDIYHTDVVWPLKGPVDH